MEFDFNKSNVERPHILRALDKRLDYVVSVVIEASRTRLASKHEEFKDWEDVEESVLRAKLAEQMSKDPCDYVDVMNLAIMLCYISQLDEITEEMWLEAYDKLKVVMRQYMEQGTKPGVNTDFALRMVFTPITVRFNNGERTRKLYEEMMESE